MKAPTDLRYSETHEWYTVNDNVVTMGITQYAADELTDITYVELPEVGTKVTAGSCVGEVESVKATSELLSALSGEIVEVNTELADHPELINDDAFGQGWLLKIQTESTEPIASLMTAGEYEAFVT
jgi:glycine cleavage system H protein